MKSVKVKMSNLILKIGNIHTEIEGLPEDHKKGLEKKLSFRPEGYQFSPMFNKFVYDQDGKKSRRFWDGWKRQFWSNKTRTYFPTGLFSLCSEYFKENNISFSVFDTRQKPEQNLFLDRSEKIILRDYQIKSRDTACNVSRGLVQVATSGGKTVISAAIIEELKVSPFLFFVTSIDLLTQAKESFEDYFRQNGNPIKVGQIGGGIIDIQDINVCTIQTIVRALGEKWTAKYKYDSDDTDDNTDVSNYKKQITELVHETKGSISDEVQHWKAETCQIVAKHLKSCYYTYGFSATTERDAGDDMLIQACFGKKIVQITASELIEQGYLVKPYIKFIHIKNRKSKFKQWQAIYKDRIVDCPEYNSIVANISNSFIEQGLSVLTLIKQIDHGKRLSKLITGSQFLSGASPKDKRLDALNNLRNGYIKAITSSVIFDEGINVQSLDCVNLGGGGKSKTRAMQRIGRITRSYTRPDGTKKIKAIAIDYVIHDKYLLDHAKEREKMYRTEPLYDIEHIET